MKTYEVVQKLLSLGPAYEIRRADDSALLATVRGKLLSLAPKLVMVDGTGEEKLAVLTANMIKTKFTMKDGHGKELATLSFPILALKKTFKLTIDGAEYKADGGWLGGEFACFTAGGAQAFVIKKKLAVRDTFHVTPSDAIPRDVALLAAVAVDQKLFQDDD